MQQEKTNHLATQIERAMWLAFSRKATAMEQQKYAVFARRYGLPNLCRVLLNLNEFTFAD